jgi:SAM-dependent methyltransferase
MRVEHVALLACPACRGELTLTGQPGGAGQVADGELGCGACGAVYPVRGRVPRFVSTANYASGFGLQWNTHARTQYDSFNGTRISESRFFAQTRWPRELLGQVVLEVGSGSGRFTEQAASTGATVVSLEYSSAVDANIAANGDRDNVLVVQADLYSMPLHEASFDRVVCIGVLQHTPDVERAFLTLVRYLKPGGHLAVDVYRRPRGVRRLLNTKYWVRPLTSRVPPAALYAMTSRYVKAMWPVARLLARVPLVGRRLNWMLLIGDYQGVLPLGDAQLREWAILDTFDMLAPAYDSPQDRETLERWFVAAGMTDIEVHYGHNGIEGRGTRPFP